MTDTPRLREHRLLRRFFHWVDQYRSEALSAEGLQQNLSGLMGALEGDVPKGIRDAFFVAEGEIDTIRFSMGPARARQEILKVLEHLEQLIDSGSGST